MNTFKDVKINDTFYTANGQPSKKIADNKAISLVPQLVGFDFQDVIQDVEFNINDNDHVYGIGNAKGYRS